jgi:flagellar hook assembly protein FlgD
VLAVYDVNGRLVRDLATGSRPAGAHSVEWDGSRTDGARAAAGIYWARLRFGEQVLTRRIALVR